MNKLLQGKKALEAGVANAKNIAWGVAQVLHAHGAEIGFTCVESARRRTEKLAREIGNTLVVSCDVSDAAIDRAVAEIGAAFGGQFDIPVHSIAYANLDDLGREFVRIGWRTALGTSDYLFVALSRATRPLMKHGGSIMTLSFAGGERVVPSYNVMSAAKAALACSLRYLAYILGPYGIRVNAISPGPIATMLSMVIDRFDDALKGAARMASLLKCVSPLDVGNAAVFLCRIYRQVLPIPWSTSTAGSMCWRPEQGTTRVFCRRKNAVHRKSLPRVRDSRRIGWYSW